jgi:lipopolysaccharide biosynthesis protein
MNRLCVFAHFDQDDTVDDYVFFYLESLKRVCRKTVFVTASVLTNPVKARLRLCCDLIIERNNQGYDFVSWQVGLREEFLADYEEILLCNDSVYGPLFPLEDVFDSMSKKDCDFWGMTESRQISYHLHSYFLVFRRPVFLSPIFQTFWNHTRIQKTKTAIIHMYEVGLTKILLEAGFVAGVYAAYRPTLPERLVSLEGVCRRKTAFTIANTWIAGKRALGELWTNFETKQTVISETVTTIVGKTDRENEHSSYREQAQMRAIVLPRNVARKIRFFLTGENLNLTHLFWKELIVRRRMPFLKVELLRDNPMNVKINNFERVLASRSDYDVGCIKAHLERMKKTKTGIADNRHK